MTGWFAFWRRRASWPIAAAAIAAQFAFSMVFLNGGDSAWEKAVAGGGGKVPEMLPGLPAVEPARSMEALRANGAVDDYLLWQAIDVPFALLNVLAITAAMALFLRKAGVDRGLLHAMLFLPIIYFAAELVENGMVAAFALEAFPPNGAPALVQQVATTTKLASGTGGMALGLLSLIGAVILDVARLFRR